jgi:hypothetical protein
MPIVVDQTLIFDVGAHLGQDTVARNKALGWGRTVRVEVETVRLPELMANIGVPYYSTSPASNSSPATPRSKASKNMSSSTNCGTIVR